MTTLETAFNGIEDNLTSILQPLIDDGTIKEVVFGMNSRNSPELPFLRVVYEDAKLDMTTIGSIGNREAWIQPIKIGSTIKETGDPQLGYRTARSILSKARDLLLENRQFNYPEVVRKVDSDTIVTVPYAFGNKKTIYGAGTTLKINFIL